MMDPYRTQPPVERKAKIADYDHGSALLMVMLAVAVIAGGVLLATAPPRSHMQCSCEEGSR